jgi:hypothetical protein
VCTARQARSSPADKDRVNAIGDVTQQSHPSRDGHTSARTIALGGPNNPRPRSPLHRRCSAASASLKRWALARADARRAARPAMLVALVSLLAACGSTSPHVANLTSTNTTTSASTVAAGPTHAAAGTALAQAIAFAACMRSHAEPNYPDPTIGRNGEPVEHLSSNANPTLNPNTPQFQTAERICLARQPPESPVLKQVTATKQQQELKFAQCMRTHGVPNFPDPKLVPGGFELQLPRHMNPNSPQITAAQQTCTKLGDGPASF